MNETPKRNHLELKRAKIPLRICLKLALKNMWKKKFRYIIMFLICSLSLAFLSFTIELNGNILTENVYTMIENGYRFTDIYKHVETSKEAIKENEYNKYAYTSLEGSNYENIKNNVGKITIHEYAAIDIDYAGINREDSNYFFTGYINTLIKYDETNDYDLICGRRPVKGTKEILITDYLAKAFDYFHIYPNINSIYDYLNKHLNLGRFNDYIIVGIVRTNYDTWTKFSNIESVDVSDKANYSYEYDFLYFNSVIIDELYFNLEKIGPSKLLSFNNRPNGSVNSLGKWRVELADKNLKSEDADGFYEANSPIGLTTETVNLCNYRNNHNNRQYNFGHAPQADDEIVIPYTWVSYLYGFTWKISYQAGQTTDTYEHRNYFNNVIQNSHITLTLTTRDSEPLVYQKTYKVVGLTYDTQTVSSVSNSRVLQIENQEYQNIYYALNTIENHILVELPNNAESALQLFKNALKAGYVIDVFAYRSDIDSYTVDPFIDLMSKAGLFIFAVFTMGLIWTIVSIEIVDSKKEIGILRSIGLSGGKVAFIFIFQTASVIFLSYFLGVFISYKLIPIFNSGIMDEYNKIILYMYTFTYRTPLFLGIFVIIMTLISAVFPLIKILSHKIIDVINERDA